MIVLSKMANEIKEIEKKNLLMQECERIFAEQMMAQGTSCYDVVHTIFKDKTYKELRAWKKLNNNLNKIHGFDFKSKIAYYELNYKEVFYYGKKQSTNKI